MSSIGWKPPEERDPEIQQIPGIGARLMFMRVIVVVVLSLLVYRVYYLQQTKGTELAERATLNQFAVLTTDAPRGYSDDELALLEAIMPAKLTGSFAELNGGAYDSSTGHTGYFHMPSASQRGGHFHNGISAGAFAIDVISSPAHSSEAIGFRCCAR